MSDLTQTRLEIATGEAQEFLAAQRGAQLDGLEATDNLMQTIRTNAADTDAFLKQHKHPKLDGLFVPISKHNHNQFAMAARLLPGYVVLVPGVMVDRDATQSLFPGIVSEHTTNLPGIRLHVLQEPFRNASIGYGASTILSAAGQSETRGVGEHGKTAHDGLEAEHFMALLAAPEAWGSAHINHVWKQAPNTSVATELTTRLLGRDVPLKTITITQQDVETGNAMLLWHENLTNPDTNQPEDGGRPGALVVVQALGFEAIRSTPHRLDEIKGLLAS